MVLIHPARHGAGCERDASLRHRNRPTGLAAFAGIRRSAYPGAEFEADSTTAERPFNGRGRMTR